MSLVVFYLNLFPSYFTAYLTNDTIYITISTFTSVRPASIRMFVILHRFFHVCNISRCLIRLRLQLGMENSI